jgi:hypothetical protein
LAQTFPEGRAMARPFRCALMFVIARLMTRLRQSSQRLALEPCVDALDHLAVVVAKALLGDVAEMPTAAPAIFFCCRVSKSAASSTIGPRAVLTRYAVGFIRARSSRPTRPRERWLSTTWTVMKSAVENSSSLVA